MIKHIDTLILEKFVTDDEKMPLHHALIYLAWFCPLNWLDKWYYRIFARGVCAIKGCNQHHSNSAYLPDGLSEWWCDRCWAEGFGYTTYTYDFMYGDDKFKDFVDALRGK